MAIHNLGKIFQPKSVAVIGASERQTAVGRTVLNNMLRAGFDGGLYPINPQRKEVLGLLAFPDVRECPERPELAVVCTRAATTPAIVRQCGEAGVGGVVILSAGFRETGAAGKELETQLRAEANRWPEMRLIGPNCLGVLSPRARLNASFATAMPKAGQIAFISQSGALCTSILDWSLTANIGFSHFVSIGNAIDVDFADLIDYLATDPLTSSIVLYVESIERARDFMSAARAYTLAKPIVVYKAGRFAASAHAAASHTGAMAGVDAVYEAAFQRAGMVRVYETEDMFDCAELLAARRLPKGRRLAIVTNAGGPGVMATDELLAGRGELAELSAETIDRLNQALPAHWSHGNPVDVLGDAGPDRFARATRIVLDDRGVDAVLAILTPQAMTDPAATAKEAAIIAAQSSKPLLAAWMGGESVEEGRRLLTAAGVATYHLPDRAVRAFGYMLRYARNRETLYETPRDVPVAVNFNRPAARELIAELSPDGVHVLSERDSKTLLTAYGVPTTMPRLAQTPLEVAKLGREIGFPIVMKIHSPDITHKTEVGGVETGISDADAARRAFERITSAAHSRRPDARIEGVTLQPMVSSPTGVELIVGAKRDPVFGAVILVGAGGIAAEVLGDRALELPPLNERLARRMLESLRVWPIIQGFRGRPAVNIDRLVEVLMRISYLVADNPQLLELDVNPLLATPLGAIALDARVILDAAGQATPSRPYAHLAIRPYPEEYVRGVCLANQESVVLRPIKPEDEPLWHELLSRTSRRSLWQRFRYLFKESTHELATRFCYIDYDRTMAIVAESEVDGKKQLVGVSRLVSDADHESAEFAVLVEDAWQRKGLGSLLTQYCVEIGDRWGLREITSETTADNYGMRAIFAKMGFQLVRRAAANEWLYRKPLRSASHEKHAAAEQIAAAAP